ncbi:uncharacterized protein LOC110053075, partial [Orbicella faveolata]|uniref:uncharacterized protein LOC110053075 n=1 Tax=Orbicella faveolata TaxID=48498 RepID=UPI0009E4EE52
MNLFPKKRRSVCKNLYIQNLTSQDPLPGKERREKNQELLREYDPFPAQNIRTVTDYQNEILDLFDDATHEGGESKGRRYIRWRFIRGLEKDLTTNFMAKIRENVSTAFYLRHVFSYQLRNIEDEEETVILFYKNTGSPWINRLEEAEEWLSRQEKSRLELEGVARPNTKWVFESFFNVDLKVVLDRQPLVGTGPLPD